MRRGRGREYHYSETFEGHNFLAEDEVSAAAVSEEVADALLPTVGSGETGRFLFTR